MYLQTILITFVNVILFMSFSIYSAPVPSSVSKTILSEGIEFWKLHQCTFPPASAYDPKEGYLSQCDIPYDEKNPTVMRDICVDIVELSNAICSKNIKLGEEGESHLMPQSVSRNIEEFAGPDPSKICAQLQALTDMVSKRWLKEWKKTHTYFSDLVTDGDYGCKHVCGGQPEAENSYVCTTIYLLTAAVLNPNTEFVEGSNLTNIALPDSPDSQPTAVTPEEDRSKPADIQPATTEVPPENPNNDGKDLLTPAEKVADELKAQRNPLGGRTSLLEKLGRAVPHIEPDELSKAAQSVVDTLTKANSKVVTSVSNSNDTATTNGQAGLGGASVGQSANQNLTGPVAPNLPGNVNSNGTGIAGQSAQSVDQTVGSLQPAASNGNQAVAAVRPADQTMTKVQPGGQSAGGVSNATLGLPASQSSVTGLQSQLNGQQALQNSVTGQQSPQNGAPGLQTAQRGAAGLQTPQNGTTVQQALQNSVTGLQSLQNGAPGLQTAQNGAAGLQTPQNGTTGQQALQNSVTGQQSPQNRAPGLQTAQSGAAGLQTPQNGTTGQQAPQNSATGQQSPQNGAPALQSAQNGTTGQLAPQNGTTGRTDGQSGLQTSPFIPQQLDPNAPQVGPNGQPVAKQTAPGVLGHHDVLSVQQQQKADGGQQGSNPVIPPGGLGQQNPTSGQGGNGMIHPSGLEGRTQVTSSNLGQQVNISVVPPNNQQNQQGVQNQAIPPSGVSNVLPGGNQLNNANNAQPGNFQNSPKEQGVQNPAIPPGGVSNVLTGGNQLDNAQQGNPQNSPNEQAGQSQAIAPGGIKSQEGAQVESNANAQNPAIGPGGGQQSVVPPPVSRSGQEGYDQNAPGGQNGQSPAIGPDNLGQRNGINGEQKGPQVPIVLPGQPAESIGQVSGQRESSRVEPDSGRQVLVPAGQVNGDVSDNVRNDQISAPGLGAQDQGNYPQPGNSDDGQYAQDGRVKGIPNLYEDDVERETEIENEGEYAVIDDQYAASPDQEEDLDKSYKKEMEEVATSSHFMAYFITVVVVCIVGYVLYHNKKSVMAILIEGRRQPTRRRTTSNSEHKYEKLSQNVDDVLITPADKAATTKNYIY